MKVRYIYSACIEIEANGIIILTDPWFTDGIYDGSWYQYPRIEDPLSVLSEPDVIYVSHIHPDHYDPVFLTKIFEKWGPKPIIIPEFPNNYLAKKAKFDGFEVTCCRHINMNGVDLHIVPNIWGSASDIDSALLVHHVGQTVLNLNDCLFNPNHAKQLSDIISMYTDKLDLLALGYTGAGTYPQTYFDITEDRDELLKRAEKKKQTFFEGYRRYCEYFPARHHLPFAGKYLLGGKLADLNPYRGVADAVEVCDFDDQAIILADAGYGIIDLSTNEVSSVRKSAYSLDDIQQYITENIKTQKLAYETDFTIAYSDINFMRYMIAAYKKAFVKSELNVNYFYVFHVMEDSDIRESYLLNCYEDHISKYDQTLQPNKKLPEPRTEMYLDYRQLFGLLTGVYHWNNAEIGSQIPARRYPVDAHNYAARAFLNFMAIA